MPHHIRRKHEFVPAKWNGGSTTELFIHPPGSDNAARNFALRISSAVVEMEESVFSDFSGYTRHIAPLTGVMRLDHEGRYSVTLNPCETDSFDGGWGTRSHGRCVDFNLIHRPDWSGCIQAYAQTSRIPCGGKGYTGIYALADHIAAKVAVDGETFHETLNSGDFLLIESAGLPGDGCRLERGASLEKEGCFAIAAQARQNS